MREVTLGIDIGGTNTKLGLVDRNGNCIAASSIETFADKPIDIFLSRLFEAIKELSQVADEAVIKAVGIGAPNANYYTGQIEKAVNLKGWGDMVPLAFLIKDKLGVPVALTNDANAAALGEMKFGAAKGMRNFMVVTLGTGLGSGIVVNGDLLYGHDGFAGEWGHVTVKPEGRLCGCGRKGCLETYVSATGIKRTIFELMAEYNGKTVLQNVSFEQMTAKKIFEAAEAGDELAMRAFKVTGNILGRSLADAVACLAPEAIVLFGGLASAGHWIVAPTVQAFEDHVLSFWKGKVKIITSDLKGDNTAVLGSSALAWQELDKQTQVALA